MKPPRPLGSALWPLALVLGLGSPAAPTRAAERWVPLGPAGGMVRQLAQSPSDPARLYAATERVGLFASRDGGRSWRSIRAGLPGGYLLKLAVAPRDPDTLLATTYGGTPFDQVWHSEDGGSTWSRGTTARGRRLLPPRRRFSVRFRRPANGVRLDRERDLPQPGRRFDLGFLGAAKRSYGRPRATGADARDLLRGRQRPRRFSWRDLSQRRLWPHLAGDAERRWSGPRRAAGAVFFRAGVLYAQWSHALYSSTDGATTWSLAARLPTLSALDFAIAPSGTFYAATETGVYSSADGAHWSPSEVTSVDQATPRDGLSHLAVVSGGPRPGSETVIAGGRRGFWRSADRGASWRPASRGIAVHDVLDLAVLPNSQGTLLGSFDEGLFRIDREDDSWRRLPSQRGFENPYLAADPHHPGRVYALGPHDVGVSDDRGNTWRKVGELPNNSAHLFRVDPVHPDVLYAGILLGGGSQGEDLVYRSVNGGATWSELPDIDYLADFTFDPAHPQVGYRATFSGLDKTTDGGDHWTTLPGIATQLLGAHASSVLLDPKTRALYVGTENLGVFRSTDSGRTFRRINLGLPRGEGDLPGVKPYVSALMLDAAGNIFASLAYAGVFRLERGQGWKAVNAGLPLDTFPGLLVADPAVPGLLYAGSLGASVLRLEDR